MKVIVSASIPLAALTNLKAEFEVLTLQTNNLTYQAIANHPDIWMTPSDNGFLVAPNLPESFQNQLKAHQIPYEFGSLPVGNTYPASAHYNAVVTPHVFVHHLTHTDPQLLKVHIHKQWIHVNQAYTRCSLLALDDTTFITSDRGIEQALKKAQKEVLYVVPLSIQLPGFDHGFFGGTCGLCKRTLYTIGSIEHHPQRQQIEGFLQSKGYHYKPLCTGTLFDGGSLFFYP